MLADTVSVRAHVRAAEPRVLVRSFYERDTRLVAFELIEKVLVLGSGKNAIRGKIVETEAYLGASDPASHAYRGVTKRNRVMFGLPGVSYVYSTYGFHYCFNVVTESDGTAGAVLIRAVEPLSGIEIMKQRRKVKRLHDLTSGPGKLTQAYGITTEHSGCDLTKEGFCIEESPDSEVVTIGVSPRIGIREARQSLFRFYLEGNPFVSKGFSKLK